MYCGSKWW